MLWEGSGWRGLLRARVSLAPPPPSAAIESLSGRHGGPDAALGGGKLSGRGRAAVDSCRGEDGRRCGSPDPPGPAPAHPFTDPCISPARKYLLSTMYTTSVGREASRAPAMETP